MKKYLANVKQNQVKYLFFSFSGERDDGLKQRYIQILRLTHEFLEKDIEINLQEWFQNVFHVNSHQKAHIC